MDKIKPTGCHAQPVIKITEVVRMNFKKIRASLWLASLLLIALLSLVACDKGSEAPPDTDAPTETEGNTEGNTECAHLNTEYIVVKAATCTEKGSSSKVCTDCNTVLETIELDTVSHTELLISGKAPSCSAEGLTEGKKCSVCQTVLVAQEPIAKLAHTERIIESVAATCTVSGRSAGKDCSVCGSTIVEPEQLPALNHNEGDWIIDKVADVGVQGSKHTECTRCQTTIKTDIIAALDAEHVHEGKTWSVTTPSSCTAEGVKSLLCECGKVMETAKLERSAHTEEKVLGTAATCTSTGLTDGKKCSVCGAVIVAQQTIAKAKHTEVTVLGKSAGCTEYGTTNGKKCSVCGETTLSQLPIPPTGHSFDSGTCVACGEAQKYGIWIVDGLGNPVSNVIVKVLKDGEQVKMYPYNGTHLELDIEAGNYQIELDLSQTGKSYVYDADACVLTHEERYAAIRLFETTSEPEVIFVGSPISADYNAYSVGQGSYKLTLTPNDYTFFIFRPTAAAIYTLTYECESNLTISYHGSSFFVQGSDITEGASSISKYENGLSVSVYSSNIGGDLVFAIKSDGATSCVINIANAGDPGTRLEDEPWTPYLEDKAMVEKQLSASKAGTYTTINLTDTTVKAVFNETDGYYHLNTIDGPIIFIDLTTDSQFVSSIQTISANQRIGVYIYDINGNISEKRSYNELFLQYGMPNSMEKVDEPIRIPLTAKLAEAIKSFGDKNSWWAEGSETNIFDKVLLGSPYNREYAWLLYCGYYS